jgi:hypothetical protein
MDSYGYDDNRRLHWLLIVAAVLGGAALLATGFGLGRVSAPSSGPARGGSAAAQAGPGPRRTVNGVPVGYAHTQAGAVAAATNFLMVVDGQLLAQPDKYRSAIETISAPDAQPKQRSDADTRSKALGLTVFVREGHSFVYRTIPLTYHVDRYDGPGAQVSIWAENFFAVDGVEAMTSVWATSVLTLQWVDGDWKMLSIGQSGANSFGPVPVVSQPYSGSMVLPPQVGNYTYYTQAGS